MGKSWFKFWFKLGFKNAQKLTFLVLLGPREVRHHVRRDARYLKMG